ncbi:malectin domain-containing carbohydrate-binding protein [Halococcus agarilyticus]|uniref:malectin domain-containing carbohydrate-binding protein n=1 Tax=Halococcus agarilyticus TaxID=1232219 RepID=UPI00067766ED|nr:malectin domain-containing carbohydrate-binding protein [Halococcus agarilyticus]
MSSISRGSGNRRWRIYLLVAVLALTAPLMVAMATDAFSTATLSRDANADVVTDSEGPLGVTVSRPATGTTSDYLGLENQFGGDVSITVALDSGSPGDLVVGGQNVGGSASVSLAAGSAQQVHLAVTCDDALVGQPASATIEVSGSGASATLNRSATIESGCTPDSGGGGGETVFAVNAGGGNYTAGDGTVYRADTAYTGGASGVKEGESIGGTTDDPLYRSERKGDFEYDVSLPDGEYEVTFMFAEIYWGGDGNGGGTGSRVFDVSAEGSQVITQLDVHGRVGHDTALNLTRTVTVTDGRLDLGFTPSADKATLGAIRVDEVEQPTSGETVFAVNAGGGNYTTDAGTVYRADTGFSGGASGVKEGESIDGTTDDPLYRSERKGDFEYDVSLPDGEYEVTFKFAEIYWGGDGNGGGTGSRVFDVTAEGSQVIDALDVYRRAGHDTALDLTRTVTVTDGRLDLGFTPSADKATLGAIRVRNASGGSTTATTAGSTTESPSGQQPYGGTARTLPGRVQAEDFDTGGEGVSYHDTTPGEEDDTAGEYRSSDVDIEAGSGGHVVGSIETDEWLEYTVDVSADTSCRIAARVSSVGGGSFAVSVDGIQVAKKRFSGTGSYGTYRTIRTKKVSLSAGRHVIRITADKSTYELDWIEC